MSEYEFVIIGGGDAGFAAASTLREEGADGSILVVSRDPDPPYDRTAVSKGFLGGEKSREDVLLGGADWFTENKVDLLVRTSAMKVDTEAHTVTLSNKDVVHYGKLLLATGANVNRLRVDGGALDGIHYLRTLLTAKRAARGCAVARGLRGRFLHRHRGRGDFDLHGSQVQFGDAGGCRSLAAFR